MVTIRVANVQAVAEVLLALRRDAAGSRAVARDLNQAGHGGARADRLIATAERLEELAEQVYQQLTPEQQVAMLADARHD